MSSGPLIRWLTAGKDCGRYVSDHVASNHKSFLSLFLRRLLITAQAQENRLRGCACVRVSVQESDLPSCDNKCSCMWVQASLQSLKLAQGNILAWSHSTERESVIDMRVFTVNKNKGWQAGWLLRRNAPSSHLHSFLCLFGCLYPSPKTPTQQHIVFNIRVNYLLGADTWQGWPQQCVCVVACWIYSMCLISRRAKTVK